MREIVQMVMIMTVGDRHLFDDIFILRMHISDYKGLVRPAGGCEPGGAGRGGGGHPAGRRPGHAGPVFQVPEQSLE